MNKNEITYYFNNLCRNAYLSGRALGVVMPKPPAKDNLEGLMHYYNTYGIELNRYILNQLEQYKDKLYGGNDE